MHTRITLMTSVLALAALGLSLPAFSQGCPTHQALLDKADEIFETQAVDRLGEVYHSDAVVHSPEGTTKGLDNIVENMKKFYAEVSDAKGVNHDVICSGDKMAVRWTGTGMMGGQKVSVTGITIYQVRDGKIAESWEEVNTMAMMMQMGYELKPPGGK